MMLIDHDRLAFARLAEAAVAVRNEGDFRALIGVHLQPLLPHGMFLAVLGGLDFDQLTVHSHLAIGYPDWALAQVTEPLHISDRPVLQQWLHTRGPVIVCPIKDEALLSERERFEFAALGLRRVAVHGLPDLDNRMGSYFSFGQVDPDLEGHRLHTFLSIITPLLHVALRQALYSPRAEPSSLTSIERELLKWLAAGRSNQEMAALRHRSLATVRNQLNALYAKLGVSNRAEAVSIAMRQSLNVPTPYPR